MNNRIMVSLVVASVLVLSGCGSDDGGEAASTTTEAVEADVTQPEVAGEDITGTVVHSYFRCSSAQLGVGWGKWSTGRAAATNSI